jgi:prepilin-type N-terminal cleavage/methylation domain-containing protein
MKKVSKGFTLVEIMIVVAIIGIVIAIAVPAFLRAREQSRATACQENLSKIDGAKEQWSLEQKKGQGDPCAIGDLIGAVAGEGYLKVEPVCPANNIAYTVNPIGTDPACDYVTNASPFAVKHVLPTAGVAIAP